MSLHRSATYNLDEKDDPFLINIARVSSSGSLSSARSYASYHDSPGMTSKESFASYEDGFSSADDHSPNIHAHNSLLPSSAHEFVPRSRRSRRMPGPISMLKRVVLLVRRRFLRSVPILLAISILAIVTSAYFRPSYTSPPAFVIPPDENLMIVSNIIDTNLIMEGDGAGPWTRSLLDLVTKFDPERIYVSVYGGPKASMQFLDKVLGDAGIFARSILAEEDSPLDTASLPRVPFPPSGTDTRLKRIPYLAALRNKALEPLTTETHNSTSRAWDKILFLNDVHFSANDALRLLWGTAVTAGEEVTVKDIEGNKKTVQHPRTSYRSACAMDYSSPLKLYDAFATRDLEGYSMGAPLFPYFSSRGKAESRNDLLNQRDKVRVRSCWGGMVAFDGRFFQELPAAGQSIWEFSKTLPGAGIAEEYEDWKKDMFGKIEARTWKPIRFRSLGVEGSNAFHEASEACLVQADVQMRLGINEQKDMLYDKRGNLETDVGVYLNPYVRIAYDAQTYERLWWGHKVERTLPYVQAIGSWWANMPRWNPRRTEVFGKMYHRKVWVEERGSEGGAVKQALREKIVSDWDGKAGLGSKGWGEEVQVPGQRSLYTDGVNGRWEDREEFAERGSWCVTRGMQLLREKGDGTAYMDGRNWDAVALPQEPWGEGSW